MGLLSLNLPVIGQSSATEDQKVRDALAAIQTDYNGNLTDANIAATAGIQESKLSNGATGLAKGAFYAYRAAAVSTASAAAFTVVFDTELFDVSGWHDVATGTYTPQVAGYYRLSWGVSLTSTTASLFSSVQKNAAGEHTRGQITAPTSWSGAQASLGTAVVQANGTTDSFRVQVTNSVGALAVVANQFQTYFCGELIGRS